jgi:dihydrofolate reductase
VRLANALVFSHDMTITRIPILLGEGISLFGKTERDIRLRHMETKSYANGFVRSRYEIPA